jgi:hypothetical protein
MTLSYIEQYVHIDCNYNNTIIQILIQTFFLKYNIILWITGINLIKLLHYLKSIFWIKVKFSLNSIFTLHLCVSRELNFEFFSLLLNTNCKFALFALHLYHICLTFDYSLITQFWIQIIISSQILVFPINVNKFLHPYESTLFQDPTHKSVLLLWHFVLGIAHN